MSEHSSENRKRIELLRVEEKPKEGCERFITIEVTTSSDAIIFSMDGTDNAAKEKLKELNIDLSTVEYVALRGRARLPWKDDAARNSCKVYETLLRGRRRGQRRHTRWEDVEEDTKRLLDGEQPPRGPVFLHPAFTGSREWLLKPLDGARRMMSPCEAKIEEIEVIVLRPADDKR